ncbi:MAG: hypothetical protein AAF410_06315 [Pseudomonadota bacterium]
MTDDKLSMDERNNLLNRIDELETLLAKKKAEVGDATPRIKVGTDGIPVLFDEFDFHSEYEVEAAAINTDQATIEDIITKIDEDVSQDLDELIGLLKNSIIEEVKNRLLKELSHNDIPQINEKFKPHS